MLLRLLEEEKRRSFWGENTEIISPSNLTLVEHLANIDIGQSALHHVIFDGSGHPEPLLFVD